MALLEPFTYAHWLFQRSVLLKKEPTRDQISVLLYVFREWACTEHQVHVQVAGPAPFRSS